MMAAVDAQLATIGGNGQSARRGSLCSKPPTRTRTTRCGSRICAGWWGVAHRPRHRHQVCAVLVLRRRAGRRRVCADGRRQPAVVPCRGQPNRDAYWRALEALGVKKQAELEKQARERRGVPRTGPTKSDTEGLPLGRLDADGRNANPTSSSPWPRRGVFDAPRAAGHGDGESAARRRCRHARKDINTYAAAQPPVQTPRAAARRVRAAQLRLLRRSGDSGEGGGGGEGGEGKAESRVGAGICAEVGAETAAEAAQVAAQASVEASDAAQAAKTRQPPQRRIRVKLPRNWKLTMRGKRQMRRWWRPWMRRRRRPKRRRQRRWPRRAARQKAIAAAARAGAEADAKASAKAAEQAAAAEEAPRGSRRERREAGF